MGRMDGKVALITGAARGQGRSHAVRLAEEGADIIATDIVDKIETAVYDLSTPEDLAETVKLVETLGRKIIALPGDVRSQADMDRVVAAGLKEFGHIDVVVANAGIWHYSLFWELTDEQWDDMHGVNLKGVWHTIKAVAPAMIEAGRGGSIIMTSSTAGMRAIPNSAHYVSAKHGVVGLMRACANELAEYKIRVNTIHPTTVPTPMILNDATYALFRPDLEHPTMEDAIDGFAAPNLFPVPWVDPIEISHGVLFLASDESRFVTGHTLCVDAGFMAK